MSAQRGLLEWNCTMICTGCSANSLNHSVDLHRHCFNKHHNINPLAIKK